jgi:hypothetical protein
MDYVIRPTMLQQLQSRIHVSAVMFGTDWINNVKQDMTAKNVR